MPEEDNFLEYYGDPEVDLVVDKDIEDDQDSEDELLGDDGGEGIADSDAIDIIIAQDPESDDFYTEPDIDDDDYDDDNDGDSDDDNDGDSDDDDLEKCNDDICDDNEVNEDIDDSNKNEYEDYDGDF